MMTKSKSSPKPIVGIDVDGVLADFAGGVYKLSREFLKKPPLSKTTQIKWDFEDDGFTKKEVDYIWSKIENSRNWWMTLEKLPNTSDLMRKYYGYNTFFITSRMPTVGLSVEAQTQEWLFQNYAITDASVIVTDNAKGKVQEAISLGLEWFIDDKDKNCLEIKKAVPECEVYIQDAPYNKDWASSKHGVERIASVNEFLKLVREGK